MKMLFIDIKSNLGGKNLIVTLPNLLGLSPIRIEHSSMLWYKYAPNTFDAKGHEPY